MNIENAYGAVFKDMLLHGPDLFKGVYDAKNGNEMYMHGIGTVMEYIADRAGGAKRDKFDTMFLKNLIASKKG